MHSLIKMLGPWVVVSLLNCHRRFPSNLIATPFQASLNGKKGVVTVCEAGGTMKASVNFPQACLDAYHW